MRAAVIGEFKIFAGSANPALAKSIACELGARLGGCVVDRYPDGNVAVELLESVRRKEVFLMQSTSPPASDHLVELLALADACRRAGAGCITAIVPYFGYGRADKHSGRREPIMARLVADVLQVVGIEHLVMVACIRRRSKAFFIFRWTA
jgi:ribose-phosphate pyrophosphokinase